VELELNDFSKTNVDVPYKEAAMLICVTEERTKIPGRFVVAMTLFPFPIATSKITG